MHRKCRIHGRRSDDVIFHLSGRDLLLGNRKSLPVFRTNHHQPVIHSRGTDRVFLYVLFNEVKKWGVIHRSFDHFRLHKLFRGKHGLKKTFHGSSGCPGFCHQIAHHHVFPDGFCFLIIAHCHQCAVDGTDRGAGHDLIIDALFYECPPDANLIGTFCSPAA